MENTLLLFTPSRHTHSQNNSNCTPLDLDLLTYKWPEPFNLIEKAELCDKLKEKDYIECTAFNRSGHILNITLKNIQKKKITITELATNNSITNAQLSTL